ncbi:MAG: chemotaxis protein CheW [Ramlibacter sp.]
MQDTANASKANARELIAFRVGEQEFCVDIMAVRELRGWTETTPLPQAPAYVRGVINLRGTVLPVIDMGVRIGLPACEASARHVIIVVCVGDQLVGLLVDSVCDILNVAEEGLQPTPEVACETLHSFVSALVSIDDRMVGLLALDHLLPALAQAA